MHFIRDVAVIQLLISFDQNDMSDYAFNNTWFLVHNLVIPSMTILCFLLTLKAPITTTAEDIHKYIFIVFFWFFFSEKIRLDISCESSAGRGFT